MLELILMLNFFSKINRNLNRTIGIDLGSSRTRVWAESKGLIFNEPTMIAVEKSSKKVIAVGEQAEQMQGRIGKSVQVFSPVQAPKLIDEEMLKAFLRIVLARASEKVYFFSPTVLISLSGSYYPSMVEVLIKILTELGAGEILLVDQSLAAVIGSGVPVSDATGSFVLQLGANVVEATSLSLGKVVNSVYSHQAGNSLKRELQHWFSTEQKLKVSEKITQQVLNKAGSFVSDHQPSVEITGLDIKTGEPREQRILTEEILPIFLNYGQTYYELVKKLLSSVSPDLTVDILDKGLLLSGGLSQVHGLDEYLTANLKMPVFVVDEPDLTAINGVGLIIDHLDEFKQSLCYQEGRV